MTNPTIETDLGQILLEIRQELKTTNERLTSLEIGQTKLEGKIESLDEKLSGSIDSLDKKLSGSIETLDAKVEQLDKRIGNQ